MRSVGHHFEALARRHLERAGLKFLEANFSTRQGEIDLIMQDGETLVFVEVRYRHAAEHGDAASSVTPRKQRRIIHAARVYLMRYPGPREPLCRFDVISFDGDRRQPRCDWQQAAFDAF